MDTATRVQILDGIVCISRVLFDKELINLFSLQLYVDSRAGNSF